MTGTCESTPREIQRISDSVKETLDDAKTYTKHKVGSKNYNYSTSPGYPKGPTAYKRKSPLEASTSNYLPKLHTQ